MEITYLWFGTVTHSISLIITKRAFIKGSGNKSEYSSMICSKLYTDACCEDVSQLIEHQLWLKHKQTTDQGDPHSRCSCACWGWDLFAWYQVFLVALPNRVTWWIHCGEGLFYWSSRQAIQSRLFSKATAGFAQINSSPHRCDTGPTAERSLQTTGTPHNSLTSATARVYFLLNTKY